MIRPVKEPHKNINIEQVLDINDHRPEWTRDKYEVNVPENTPLNSVIIQVFTSTLIFNYSRIEQYSITFLLL